MNKSLTVFVPFLFLTLALHLCTSAQCASGTAAVSATERDPEIKRVTAEDLGMERYAIARPDSMQWIFNGRGRCYPRRWSLTEFNGLNSADGPWKYHFNFDFVEKRSGVRIVDNVPDVMDGSDPCGWNVRAGAPFCIVPQEDTWFPHYEKRTGSFHQNFKNGTVSFAIETKTIVSARANEVLMSIEIENRDAAPLTLTLLPMENGQNMLEAKNPDAGTCLVTDLAMVNSQSLEWTIPPKTKQTRNFSIMQCGKTRPSVYQANLAERVNQANEDGETQINRIASHLPILQTTNRNLDQFYKRCIASLALCRWERADFYRHPT